MLLPASGRCATPSKSWVKDSRPHNKTVVACSCTQPMQASSGEFPAPQLSPLVPVSHHRPAPTDRLAAQAGHQRRKNIGPPVGKWLFRRTFSGLRSTCHGRFRAPRPRQCRGEVRSILHQTAENLHGQLAALLALVLDRLDRDDSGELP